ncbi:isochorismate synthase [Leifsonia xyli subsp. xyli]|uniref:isochorismate synthase n=2 Tax=Leifsonia xyli subsp. xyli TaxID=59736 RepID=Q6AH99_LEIXX|nr:isochorismate mutase [Leifsonia xyli subsp. xyli str. CTCB07]ODA90345.1 isochorismate synthase [Leifsonia xyli subsp. xyli]
MTVLSVETTPLDDVHQLIPFLDSRRPLVWLRNGEGMAGIGEALRLEFSGADRIREASATWRATVDAAIVTDSVRTPGTGLVAFGAFAFADDSAATSTLIVPDFIVGRRDGRSWVTRISPIRAEKAAEAGRTAEPGKGNPAATAIPRPTAFGDKCRVNFLPGSLSEDGYREAVATAVDRIRKHGLAKAVLARDLSAHLPLGSDARRALAELALGYPDCWTFAVDGLIGSSPETLVRVHHGTVTARVLAGTMSRGQDAAADREAADALAASAKDQDEHRFAVASVIGALRPHSADLAASDRPFTLKLPNLWHLATDVAGTLSDGSSSLGLADALHPTAAVAGTPTRDAVALIRELEPFDRGRYAGPVGWVGGDGDGEWAIALRCAQLGENGDLTAYAGAGIVADSDPDRELAETAIKFRPIVEAFG